MDTSSGLTTAASPSRARCALPHALPQATSRRRLLLVSRGLIHPKCYTRLYNSHTLVIPQVRCQKKDLDQLFVLANAKSADKDAPATNVKAPPATDFNKARALNRQEFLQVVVRLAVMRCVSQPISPSILLSHLLHSTLPSSTFSHLSPPPQVRHLRRPRRRERRPSKVLSGRSGAQSPPGGAPGFGPLPHALPLQYISAPQTPTHAPHAGALCWPAALVVAPRLQLSSASTPHTHDSTRRPPRVTQSRKSTRSCASGSRRYAPSSELMPPATAASPRSRRVVFSTTPNGCASSRTCSCLMLPSRRSMRRSSSCGPA